MMFLATTVIQNIAEFKPTIVQFYLTYDPQSQSLVSASKDLFDLPFGIMVAVFLLLSAFFHGLIAIPPKSNAIYNSDLAKGINRFRWFEYSLSSSIMIVLIATLFGVYDIATLLLIFVVNATMNLFGLVMEQLNEAEHRQHSLGSFCLGSFAGIAPWVVILLYMFGTGEFDRVPWFVWA
jgi:succinate dehydrogenase/fumarate reductase cytochrome b subunit